MKPPSSEASFVEAAGRGPLLRLLGAAVVWLVVSGILALIHSIQAHAPDFFAGCPLFTYGRLQALAETTLIYGWLANAGLGLALWMLARLSGEPLRAALWVSIGAAFWNIGVLISLIGIMAGDATGIPSFELPGYTHALLLAAYGAVGIGGVLAWSGRQRNVMFASQWYAAAALFLFPWLFSAAHVMLISFPARGVVQAVVGTWYAQGVWTFWLAPFALASAYYLVPKIAGRTLPSYELAPAGFWCLLFIGAWSGGRHLIGGPVPAWIGTVGVVTSVVMLFHYATLALNFRSAFSRRAANSDGGLELRFIVFGLGAYLLGGLLDAVSAMRGTAALLQFTWFDQAQQQLALIGAASMIFFGAIYYALPRLAGRPLFSRGLRCGHFALAAIGIVLRVAGLGLAGAEQGRALESAGTTFSEIASRAQSGLLAATAGEGLLLIGAFLFAVNFFKTAACPFYAAEAATRAGEARA